MSLLQFLGVGTVTSTKDTNTNEIMVYCPFLFPQAEGLMVATTEQVERKSVNAAGEVVKSTQMRSNSVPAVWKKMDDSNRITSPDVRSGSTVAIYHIAGQNTYYWTLDGVNPNTFRMETVMWGWNANPHIGENGDFDVDNFYVMSMDTRNGLFNFRTSNVNGEATKIDFQLNTMDGTMTLGFLGGLMLNANDIDDSWTIENAAGAILRMVSENVFLTLPDTFSIFADKIFNLKTREINIEAEEANVDIKKTRWKGDIEHTGNTSQLGDYTQTGMYRHTGDVDRTGNSVSTGTVIGLTDVRTMAVSLNMHYHGNVRNGEGVTTPALPS